VRSLMLAFTLLAPFVWAAFQEKWDARWVDYDSRGGLFHVTCPEPMQSDRAELDLATRRIGLVCFRADDGARRYVVAYADLPGIVRMHSAGQALDYLALHLLFEAPLAPLELRPLVRSTFPGREFSYACANGASIRQHDFLVGQRIYLVQVMGSAAAVAAPEADRFLQSFRARLP
jgi:hypothetical protein